MNRPGITSVFTGGAGAEVLLLLSLSLALSARDLDTVERDISHAVGLWYHHHSNTTLSFLKKTPLCKGP